MILTMSSDNYYAVRQDPNSGEWVVSMGFMSEDLPPCMVPVEARDQRFATREAAENYAFSEYSEYGEVFAEWCWEGGHRASCGEFGDFERPFEGRMYRNGEGGQDQP